MMKIKFGRYTKQFFGAAKLLFAWFALKVFFKKYYKKNIWLISEKRNEARDNGFHLFCYLRDCHVEVNAYYVITKDSADIEKLRKYGNIIIANSLKHCIFYLAATKSISSQAYGSYPFSFNLKELNIIRKLTNKEQKIVFLQHGITKDELAHSSFDYEKSNIDFFVTSAKREYDFIKKLYGYPDNAIGCVGLCRFDNLLNTSKKTEKIVLIMPTWRSWLSRDKATAFVTEKEKSSFMQTDYYQEYKKLLTDKKLINKLQEKGYKVVFYLHYQLQDYTELFVQFENESIIIADRHHYDVQDLLIKSKILVTDYSSVFFDFAYMNKPEVFFHFDYKRFVSNHYAKGYFDYEKDAFGPCFKDEKKLVDYLSDLLDRDCCQPSEYGIRADEFFNMRDNHNCERTFEAIRML